MICPMMTVDPTLGKNRAGGRAICQGNGCAWWIDTRGCSVQVIAKELLHKRLEEEAEQYRQELLAESRASK